MSSPMHPGQLPLDRSTAARLVGRGVTPLPGAGTTSRIFRVGDDLVARFPLVGDDPQTVRTAFEREHRRMEEFAEASPFPAPRPVSIGDGDAAFPLPFSLQTWVDGEVSTPSSAAGSVGLAEDLAVLLRALRRADTRQRDFDGVGRGGDLTGQDAWVAECLQRSRGLLPVSDLHRMWERLRALPRQQPDAMSHTDLVPGNVLVREGRLVGVLDTGGYQPADPALDLVSAWHLLDPAPRRRLRELLGESDLSWRRGAAWAFAQAIGLVWYYERTNTAMADLGRSTLGRLLSDPEL